MAEDEGLSLTLGGAGMQDVQLCRCVDDNAWRLGSLRHAQDSIRTTCLHCTRK